ncbi:hypothetical protein GCM10010912_16730 [Paenibacillus albidus]|uniref:ORF6C domain-containing protein n=1 Tax=Paenibacillus albidus TaxID=2041023 RepID=A0A917C4U5_9BACL|nr:Rha family transcriptional regulator [Paenibacillus albidus]GGF72268.1 hypothetical protein GCM10010912_16730 [Paenibacillus albidus]
MTQESSGKALLANEETPHFVYEENGQAMTDSRTIAFKFGKRHADILRSIKSLECSAEFTERNFAQSHYKDKTGRNNLYYKVTRDGFVFLITGFTGREAARFKEEYIAAFNRMEGQLQLLQQLQQLNPPSNFLISEEAFSQMKERVHNMEQLLVQTEQEITLKAAEQKTLQTAIGQRILTLAKNSSQRPELFRKLYRAIYVEFAVSSYRDILKKDYQLALKVVEVWMPEG